MTTGHGGGVEKLRGEGEGGGRRAAGRRGLARSGRGSVTVTSSRTHSRGRASIGSLEESERASERMPILIGAEKGRGSGFSRGSAQRREND